MKLSLNWTERLHGRKWPLCTHTLLMELAGPQSDCVGYRALMSEDGFLVYSYMTTVPMQTVRLWEEARFFLPHPVANAAQNPCLEAESHVVNNQRPCRKGHSRHSCKPTLSDAQKWELPLFLNEVLVSHPIPLMRQTKSLSSWAFLSASSPRVSFSSRQSVWFPDLCGVSSPSLLGLVQSSGAVQAGCLLR